MRIRAITFDVGGTLIEPWPSVGHVYAAVAAQFGVSGVAADVLTRNFGAVWRSCAGFDYARESWYALVRATFAGAAVHLPAEFYPAVYARFAEATAWRIYEDVVPTLQVLKERGFRLGVISNWDGRLRPLLVELGLAPYFSSLVVSCEAGRTKPARELFQQSAAVLGVELSEMLHVGDSRQMDLLGAAEAGAVGRLVVRGKTPDAPEQMASLRDLIPLLDRSAAD